MSTLLEIDRPVLAALAKAVVLAALVGLGACSKPDTETAAASENTLDAPMSIEALRDWSPKITLTREGPLAETEAFTAFLVSYLDRGRKLHAMIAVPKSRAPAAGYPMVIANHGYVPEPNKYGMTHEGADSRPGDYYRAVPELFASRGFLVVMPDYRGHNNSDGFEYINPQDDRSAAYYAEDVVALMTALDQIELGNIKYIFMWSHSMGGSVSLRALLATNIVRASSFWSTMSVDEFQPYLDDLDGPVNIHHVVGDESTSFLNSQKFAHELSGINHVHTFYDYPGDQHYFNEQGRRTAADRDAELFRSQLDD